MRFVGFTFLFLFALLKLLALKYILYKGFDLGDEGVFLYLTQHAQEYPQYLFNQYLYWLSGDHLSIIFLRNCRFVMEAVAGTLVAAAALTTIRAERFLSATQWVFSLLLGILFSYTGSFGVSLGYAELNTFYLSLSIAFLLFGIKQEAYPPMPLATSLLAASGFFTGLCLFTKPSTAILGLAAGIFFIGIHTHSLLKNWLAYGVGALLSVFFFQSILPEGSGVFGVWKAFFEVIHEMDYHLDKLLLFYLIYDGSSLLDMIQLLGWVYLLRKGIPYFRHSIYVAWLVGFVLYLNTPFHTIALPGQQWMMGLIGLMVLVAGKYSQAIPLRFYLLFAAPLMLAFGSNTALLSVMTSALFFPLSATVMLILKENRQKWMGIGMLMTGANVLFYLNHIQYPYMETTSIHTSTQACPAVENIELTPEKCAFFCKIHQAIGPIATGTEGLFTHYTPGLAYLLDVTSAGCPYQFMNGISARHNRNCMNAIAQLPEFLFLHPDMPEEVTEPMLPNGKLSLTHYRPILSLPTPYSGTEMHPVNDTLFVYRRLP